MFKNKSKLIEFVKSQLSKFWEIFKNKYEHKKDISRNKQRFSSF